MAKKAVESKHELLENPQALAERLASAETWAERHPKTVIGISVVIALLVGGFFGFRYYLNIQEEEAQEQMFQAIYYFEADSLELALRGDGNNLGFIDIVSDYGMTDAGNLANYYAGVALLKQGRYEVARLYLEDFKANDLIVQARAYSLIGDTYMEEENYEEAARYYLKAADYKSNKFFSPRYLMKAGLAFEKNSQPEKAAEVYDRVINEFRDSPEYQSARKYRAMLSDNS